MSKVSRSVFDGHGNTMEWADDFSSCSQRIRLLSVANTQFRVGCHHSIDQWVQLIKALERLLD